MTRMISRLLCLIAVYALPTAAASAVPYPTDNAVAYFSQADNFIDA